MSPSKMIKIKVQNKVSLQNLNVLVGALCTWAGPYSGFLSLLGYVPVFRASQTHHCCADPGQDTDERVHTAAWHISHSQPKQLAKYICDFGDEAWHGCTMKLSCPIVDLYKIL